MCLYCILLQNYMQTKTAESIDIDCVNNGWFYFPWKRISTEWVIIVYTNNMEWCHINELGVPLPQHVSATHVKHFLVLPMHVSTIHFIIFINHTQYWSLVYWNTNLVLQLKILRLSWKYYCTTWKWLKSIFMHIKYGICITPVNAAFYGTQIKLKAWSD